MPFWRVFLRVVFLAEGNQQVQGKVPDHHHADGKEFWQVKIHFKFAYQQPKYQGVDAQANQGNTEKPEKFPCYFGVFAFKGPYPVKDIIPGSCHCKTDGVGDIFRYFQPFFAYIRSAEIYQDTGAAHHAEFDEF